MPQWSNEPPTAPSGYSLRIIRTPAATPITAIITSPDLIGCPTHYIKNRTIPCEGPDKCPHCAEGFSWRWHGYVSAVLTATLEHVLFECTDHASSAFRTYRLLHGNLRGCHFRAHRPSKRANGRVVIECKPTDPQRTPLPDPPDLVRVLCHIWNIPYTAASITRRPRPPFPGLHVDPSKDDGRYTTKRLLDE